MQLLCVYNSKGGVGKTATAVNLAWLAARDHRRVLLWDLDPQGAASFYFQVRPRVKGGGKKLMKGKLDLDKVIKSTDYHGLDILPGDFSFRHLDLVLGDAKNPKKALASIFDDIADDYDLVILDCPPGFSLLSESMFKVADLLLVPLIPTVLSLRTLQQIRDYLGEHPSKKLRVCPFFTMVDRRKNLHKDTLAAYADGQDGFLATNIPFASAVERMGIELRPVVDFEPSCPAAQAYADLWTELRPKL